MVQADLLSTMSMTSLKWWRLQQVKNVSIKKEE